MDMWFVDETLESSPESSPDSGKENLAPPDLHIFLRLNLLINAALYPSKALIAFSLSKGQQTHSKNYGDILQHKKFKKI